MGLYGQRIGALHVVNQNKEIAQNAHSALKLICRKTYSTPPLQGARIAKIILNDQ